VSELECLAFSGVLAGCAISAKDARDPLEGWNRGVCLYRLGKVDEKIFWSNI